MRIKIECKKIAIVNERKNTTAVKTCWYGNTSAGNIPIRIIKTDETIPTMEQDQINPLDFGLLSKLFDTFNQNGMNKLPADIIAMTNKMKDMGLKIFGTERV